MLSNPNFLALINEVTKATKELIDNSQETMAIKQDFAKFVKAEATTEQDEKFVSTVTLGTPKKTPEWSEVAKNSTAEWHTTIISMLPKTTLSDIYSYEYYKGKQDATQKIEQEFANNTKRKVQSMWNEMNMEAYKILNDGFNPAAQYLSPDLEPVFSTQHFFTSELPVSGSNAFDNVLSAAAPSLDVLKEVERRSGAFVDPEGRPMPVSPKRILVKLWSKAAHEWKQLFFGEGYRTNTLVGINGTNIYTNGEYTVVESPYITSNTAYYFLSDFDMGMIDNPFYMWVMDFPTIYGEEDSVNTLTRQITYVSYYKLGLKNIPIGVYGSLGA